MKYTEMTLIRDNFCSIKNMLKNPEKPRKH